jgi:hypothetical protein
MQVRKVDAKKLVMRDGRVFDLAAIEKRLEVIEIEQYIAN